MSQIEFLSALPECGDVVNGSHVTFRSACQLPHPEQSCHTTASQNEASPDENTTVSRRCRLESGNWGGGRDANAFGLNNGTRYTITPDEGSYIFLIMEEWGEGGFRRSNRISRRHSHCRLAQLSTHWTTLNAGRIWVRIHPSPCLSEALTKQKGSTGHTLVAHWSLIGHTLATADWLNGGCSQSCAGL